MAQKPNMSDVLTQHIDGTSATLVNQAIMGGSSTGGATRYTPVIFYVPSKTGLEEKVIIPNASMIGRVYVPEPLIGATTVDVNVIDDASTGWTGGN